MVFLCISGIEDTSSEEFKKLKESIEREGHKVQAMLPYDALCKFEVTYRLENNTALEEDEVNSLSEEEFKEMVGSIYLKLADSEHVVDYAFIDACIKHSYNEVIEKRSHYNK